MSDNSNLDMREKLVVRAEDLKKEYRMGEATVNALRGLSLSVQKGEFVSIMGASGSGKSTLLSIIGCLDRPSSGVYSLMNRPVMEMSDNELAYARNSFIGFVFQTFNLLPRISSVSNVELPLVYAGVSRKERRNLALEMLDKVGLSSRADHMSTQLSGGERQRVAIARALVTRPALLLADEPTGNLDSKTGNTILELINRVHEEGNTILMVTHDRIVADRASRVICLADGQIESERIQ